MIGWSTIITAGRLRGWLKERPEGILPDPGGLHLSPAVQRGGNDREIEIERGKKVDIVSSLGYDVKA